MPSLYRKNNHSNGHRLDGDFQRLPPSQLAARDELSSQAWRSEDSSEYEVKAKKNQSLNYLKTRYWKSPLCGQVAGRGPWNGLQIVRWNGTDISPAPTHVGIMMN